MLIVKRFFKYGSIKGATGSSGKSGLFTTTIWLQARNNTSIMDIAVSFLSSVRLHEMHVNLGDIYSIQNMLFSIADKNGSKFLPATGIHVSQSGTLYVDQLYFGEGLFVRGTDLATGDGRKIPINYDPSDYSITGNEVASLEVFEG